MTRLKQRLHMEAANCIGTIFLLRSMMVSGYSDLNAKLIAGIAKEEKRYREIEAELKRDDVFIDVDLTEDNEN